jgi:hypothetical protein
MDRALWMLMQLRFKGWLRQLRRALLTVKGVLPVALYTLNERFRDRVQR